jgi:hypothetical protein
MRWEQIGTLALRYTPLDEFVAYDEAGGGQVYGAMEGRLELTGLSGNLRLTNTASRRTDGIFEPKLRGVMTTDAGTKLYVRMDGVSIPDAARGPNTRLVLTTLRLRSSVPGQERWNTAFLVHEGRGGPVGDSWGISGPVFSAHAE